MTTFEVVAKIVAEQLHLDVTTITPTTNIKNDIKADSLDIATILFAIEDEYGIEVPTEKAIALTTMQEMVDLIDSLK